MVFKKQRYTYGEHLVANSYIIGQVSLCNIALFPFKWMLNGQPGVVAFDLIYVIFIIWYYTFAFYDWFYNRKGTNGMLLSLALVFGIFLVVLLFTVVAEVLLYYIFSMLGWA